MYNSWPLHPHYLTYWSRKYVTCTTNAKYLYKIWYDPPLLSYDAFAANILYYVIFGATKSVKFRHLQPFISNPLCFWKLLFWIFDIPSNFRIRIRFYFDPFLLICLTKSPVSGGGIINKHIFGTHICQLIIQPWSVSDVYGQAFYLIVKCVSVDSSYLTS